jgi:hypothetical protein
MCPQSLVKLRNIKFHENSFSRSRVVTYGQTDRASLQAVLSLKRRDCDSIKRKSRLLVEPSVRNGASPTSATTMR